MFDIFSSLYALRSSDAFSTTGAAAGAALGALSTAGAGAALGATLASRTSLSIILPLGPVPTALARSTPSLTARFFALGDAKIFPSALAVA